MFFSSVATHPESRRTWWSHLLVRTGRFETVWILLFKRGWIGGIITQNNNQCNQTMSIEAIFIQTKGSISKPIRFLWDMAIHNTSLNWNEEFLLPNHHGTMLLLKLGGVATSHHIHQFIQFTAHAWDMIPCSLVRSLPNALVTNLLAHLSAQKTSSQWVEVEVGATPSAGAERWGESLWKATCLYILWNISYQAGVFLRSFRKTIHFFNFPNILGGLWAQQRHYVNNWLSQETTNWWG